MQGAMKQLRDLDDLATNLQHCWEFQELLGLAELGKLQKIFQLEESLELTELEKLCQLWESFEPQELLLSLELGELSQFWELPGQGKLLELQE